ncbi:hypothetical protein TNCV_3817141 [Trichonephila clavipes]|nr:hypothetical protein TNCV_3817141 [Trichonephila clavipes]
MNLYVHSPSCGAGVDRRGLTSPSVVHCQFFELFGDRQFTTFKLASLCGTVALHTSSYCAIGKSSFSKADNPTPFKLHKLLEFLLISSWRHT